MPVSSSIEVGLQEITESFFDLASRTLRPDGDCDNLLDITIVCCDGQFQWSNLLLSFTGEIMKNVLHSDASHVILPDFQIKDVKQTLAQMFRWNNETRIDSNTSEFCRFLLPQFKSSIVSIADLIIKQETECNDKLNAEDFQIVTQNLQNKVENNENM